MEFANPLFLYALTAITIPIIIHLFNFRRFKKVYFTNVRFIRELKQETQKRSQLRHLIILLMRILAIAALVLAFARPFIPYDDEENRKQKNVVSVFLDNSFSMQVESTEGSLFNVARQKAGEIINYYNNTDRFQLLTNDFKGIHQRLVSKNEMNEILEQIRISPVSRKLSEIVTRQKDLLKNESGSNKDAYILSDFQKSAYDFKTTVSDTAMDVFLVPLSAANTSNLFIDSCWFVTPIQQVNQGVTLKVRITNSSDKTYENIPVKLRIDGQQKALASFSIKPRSSTGVDLSYTHYSAGIKYGELEINDYPVTYDDHFYVSYRVDVTIPVLTINAEEESEYLNALYEKDSVFVFDQTLLRQVNYSSLPDYQLIILNNLPSLPSGLVEQLERFMQNGGHIVVFPSEELEQSNYNAFLGRFGVGNLRALDTSRTEVSALNASHLLYRDVFEEIPENMDMPSVFGHYPLRLISRSSSEPILSLQNGDVFLTQAPFGRGSIYFIASPLDSDYTNFPRHALFVPTLYKIALLSHPPQQLYYTIGKDAAIALRNVEVEGDEVFHIIQSEGDFDIIPSHLQSAGQVLIDPHGQIKETGNYTITKNGSEVAGLAYNYNRTESVLTYYSMDDLEEQVKDLQYTNMTVLDLQTDKVKRAISLHSQGLQLWLYFILAALLFLLAEVVLLRFWK